MSLADPVRVAAADDFLRAQAHDPQGTVAAALRADPQVAPHVPLQVEDSALPSDLQSHLDRQERQILIQALQATGYNRTAAAARLGLSLRQIRYRIARLHIDMPQGSDSSHEG